MAINGPAATDAKRVETVVRGSQSIPVAHDVDVAVVGAGAAGVAAACTAAEEDAETLLIDRNGYLGGTSTGGSIATFCGFYDCTVEDRPPRKIVAGFGDRVLNALRNRDVLQGPTELRDRTNIYAYDPEILKLVYDHLVLEVGVEPLLNAHVSDVILDDGTPPAITELIVETSAGPRVVRARQYVDASGDGFLAHAAGAAVLHSPSETQTSTTLFFLGGIDEEAARKTDIAAVRDGMRKATEAGEYDLPKTDGVFLVIEGRRKAWMNVTDLPGDTTDPGVRTAAEMDGRRQAEEYHRYFQNEVPGFEDSYIDHFAAQLGIRETRKVVGEYVLSHDDFAAGRRFEDAVAYCGWAREVHDPVTHASEWEWVPDGGHYDIPLRSLIARDVENVAIAGRCAVSLSEILSGYLLRLGLVPIDPCCDRYRQRFAERGATMQGDRGSVGRRGRRDQYVTLVSMPLPIVTKPYSQTGQRHFTFFPRCSKVLATR